MPRERSYTAATDCKEAQQYSETLHEDPMTDAMGAPTGDIMEGYLREHIKTCKKCKEATDEGNMP